MKIQKTQMHAVWATQWVLLGLGEGCGSDPSPAPPEPPLTVPVAPTELCPEENQAPLRNGPGMTPSFSCEVVGSNIAGGAVDWPAIDGLPQPRAFVSARADASGDGTQARPFNNLAAGVAALATSGGAIVVSRGEYAMSATLTLSAGTTLVGAGAAATTLRVSRGREGVVLAGGRGEVRGLLIRFPEDVTATSDEDTGLAVRAGATLTLEDVRVEFAARGVSAEAATVIASRVTAFRSVFAGVDLRRGSRGVFSRLWADHAGGVTGAGYGVYCDGSVVHLADSMITCNGVTGLWVRHAPPSMSGAASCDGDLFSPTGNTMCWRRVAFDENHSQGIDVSACRPTAGDACPTDPQRLNIEGRLLSVRRTQQLSGRGGDGISIGPYARVTLDPEASGVSARGLATLVATNERVGVLVEGPESVISLQGALISDNGGPGMYVQAAARAEALRDTLVSNNTGLGVGVTPTSTLVAAQGNRFLATRMGPLAPGGTVMFGDGLALSQRVGLTLTANEFTGQPRYAAFMIGVDEATITGNTGERNLYGLTAYGSLVDPRVGNSVMASNPVPPAGAPVAPTDGMMGP